MELKWDCLKMLQFLPSLIMFIFTVAFASIFLIPATSYKPKNDVVAFYWRGLWIFLSMICAVSGAANTVAMAGIDVMVFSDAILLSLLVTFVLFVVFAWCRLAGKAALYGLQRFIAKARA